jgi:hypothetical protein
MLRGWGSNSFDPRYVISVVVTLFTIRILAAGGEPPADIKGNRLLVAGLEMLDRFFSGFGRHFGMSLFAVFDGAFQ